MQLVGGSKRGVQPAQNTENLPKDGSAKTSQLAAFTLDVSAHPMSTNFGCPYPEHGADNWLRVVNRVDGKAQNGPMLLEDTVSREQIQQFDHERIPERVVHARGVGAHGHFKLLESAADLTYASLFTDTSRTTPAFVRFSTVQGAKGSADTVRDVRGFATKFYTDEGNFDIVGNNIPVFFIQDAIKFPHLIHAVKPEPDTDVPMGGTAHNNAWDFFYGHEETSHMVMWTMSDRAIPRSLRMMQGFGVNTYLLITKEGKRTFVKFHFTPELGVHSLVWDEALKINGQDPDFHHRDLYEAINKGEFPKWKFGIQTISEEDQDNFDFDILDATKVWTEEQVPIRYIGELELNRNVDEFFPETEQVAFCTGHLVPGIGFSDDPLLQGRNFSYLDTQISRLGGFNYNELPINRPIKPVVNSNRDGLHRMQITKGKTNYWPNRFNNNPPPTAAESAYVEHKTRVEGWKQRLLAPKFSEHLDHATQFINSLSPIEYRHLVNALVFELSQCDEEIVYNRMIERLSDIHFEVAKEVAALCTGREAPQPQRTIHNKSAPSLSQFYYAPSDPIIKTRRIAFLVADGFDLGVFNTVKSGLESLGAFPVVVGTRRGPIFPMNQSSGDKGIFADTSLEAARSTLFDAVFIAPGSGHVAKLREQARAIYWVREAFGHLKPIGAIRDGIDLLVDSTLPRIEVAKDNAGIVESYGVVTSRVTPQASSSKNAIKISQQSNDFVSRFAYHISQHRNWARELDGLSSQVAF